MIRLTETQRTGLKKLAKCTPGTWLQFGNGMGRYRVALRALYHRAPELLMYEQTKITERFCITGEGRGLLAGEAS